MYVCENITMYNEHKCIKAILCQMFFGHYFVKAYTPGSFGDYVLGKVHVCICRVHVHLHVHTPLEGKWIILKFRPKIAIMCKYQQGEEDCYSPPKHEARDN